MLESCSVNLAEGSTPDLVMITLINALIAVAAMDKYAFISVTLFIFQLLSILDADML